MKPFLSLPIVGIISLLILTGVSFFRKISGNTTKSTTDCLNPETFEVVYHYIQWKHKTSKKLSPRGKVLFEKGYEVEVLAQETIGRRIIFSKDGYKGFSVDLEEGYIPHTKQANLPKYQAMFCKLLERAQFKALPKKYSYTYSDGSANLWKIDHQSISYTPVTKAMSSSGIYEGGAPFTIAISSQEFEQLEKLIQEAVQSPLARQDARLKGTGKISVFVTPNLAVNHCILTASSAEKQNLEALLQAISTQKK